MRLQLCFISKAVLSIFSVCLIASCVFSPTSFKSVQYHDLGMPRIINEQGPYVKFDRFLMNGPYKNKMVFRGQNNQLVIDEYNKWAQTPESMLERYMDMAFRGKADSESIKAYSVKVTVMAFEAEINSKKAVLIVEYSIVEPLQGKNKSFSKTYNYPMKEMRPEDFSQAMANISGQFATQLKTDMEGMK